MYISTLRVNLPDLLNATTRAAAVAALATAASSASSESVRQFVSPTLAVTLSELLLSFFLFLFSERARDSLFSIRVISTTT
jgi:hypothetical protein